MHLALYVLLFFFSLGCFSEAAPKVLVSISPEKYLVDRIAQGKVEVEVLVPSGASPHDYEPTMRQILDSYKAKVWFRIGEGFETKLVQVLAPHMKIVDLREGIPLIPAGCCKGKYVDWDSHIWLSPLLLKIEAKTVAEALEKEFPEETSFFQSNLSTLLSNLDQLHEEIRAIVNKASVRTVLVAHPAFAYFCREYGFTQISIEAEGKEPSAKHIATFLQTARKLGVHAIFIQPQNNIKGAKRIAAELHVPLCEIDPYAENVVENLRTIAQLFSQ